VAVVLRVADSVEEVAVAPRPADVLRRAGPAAVEADWALLPQGGHEVLDDDLMPPAVAEVVLEGEPVASADEVAEPDGRGSIASSGQSSSLSM